MILTTWCLRLLTLFALVVAALLAVATVRSDWSPFPPSWACPGSVDGYGLGFQALCCNCLLS